MGTLAGGGGNGVIPIWALSCFLEVARECGGVEVYVCDSEADAALGVLAAMVHPSMPVVSNDSDFFVLDIPGGCVLLCVARDCSEVDV